MPPVSVKVIRGPGPIETKVGPKGYVHGWIFVGAPGVGDRVFHPQFGEGVVTHTGGGHTHVRFAGGAEHAFEHRAASEPGRFEPREAGKAAAVSGAERAPIGDLRVGDRIAPPGKYNPGGVIEGIEHVTGEDGFKGVALDVREDNGTVTTVHLYESDTPHVTRLAKGGGDAAQRIEDARRLREHQQTATAVRQFVDGTDTTVIKSLHGDAQLGVAHSREAMIREVERPGATHLYGAPDTGGLVYHLLPADTPVDQADYRLAADRARDLQRQILDRRRNQLAESLYKARPTTAEWARANNRSEVAAFYARQRILDDFVNHPPPLETAAIGGALARARQNLTDAAIKPRDLPAAAPDLPEGADVKTRMAAYRAALPQDMTHFGHALQSRATYAKPDLESLEAGKAPEITQAVVAVPDVAEDGGPGETAMHHLDVIKAAGRDLDAELRRRMAARGLSPDRLAELDRREAEYKQAMQSATSEALALVSRRQDARNEFAREHGYGSYQDMHNARWRTQPWPDRAERERLDALLKQTRDVGDAAVAGREEDHDVTMRRLHEVRQQIDTERTKVATAQRKAAMDLLSEVRPDGQGFGGEHLAYMNPDGKDLGERHAGVKAMRFAESSYPTPWVQRIKARALYGGKYRLTGAQRGKHQDAIRQITLSGSKDAGTSRIKGHTAYEATAVHELGHAAENAVPGLFDNEDAYLWSRSSTGKPGERTRSALTQIYPGKDEYGYKDEFPDHYSGKVYDHGTRELLTTGMQEMFGGEGSRGKAGAFLDADYRHWLLGTLAMH